MPADYFLTIDGVTGSSQDKAHAGAIEVASFTLGVENAATISSASGGAGAGRATFKEMRVTAPSTSVGPQLLLMCASGVHAKSAVLYARAAGPAGSGSDFLTATLSMVFVSSYQVTGDTGDGPIDDFILLYGGLHLDYRPQSPTGAPGAPVSGGWSVITGQKI